MNWTTFSLAVLGFVLAGCAENHGNAANLSASASSSASVAPAKPTVQRKTTPAALRAADEKACAEANIGACRRMADRYRGYGHTAGCGVERNDAEMIHGRDAAPMSVSIKRQYLDQTPHYRRFLEFVGKACDLGDAQACDIERSVRAGFQPSSTRQAGIIAARSDPSSSAAIAFHALWQPTEHAKFVEERKQCLTTKEGSCSIVADSLFKRRKEDAPPELWPEVMRKLEAIGDQTLDYETLLMMLDKHGYSPKVLAPLRAHAGQSLVQACVEGACVCGDAAAMLPADDARVVDLARWGCENGEAAGCYELGKLYEEGRGVEKDPVIARSLYEIACPPSRGYAIFYSPEYSPKACMRLAEIAEAGGLPPKYKERAIYYAEFACQFPGLEPDHAPCVKLATYWAKGVLANTCSPVESSWCKSSADEADAVFYTAKYSAGEGRECERPSVKELCDAHVAEIEALKKPSTEKKK